MQNLIVFGMPSLRKPDRLGFGADHPDLTFEKAAICDGQHFRFDVSPHPGIGPEFDLPGGTDVSLKVPFMDDIRAVDISLDLGRFAGAHQSLATDVSLEIPQDMSPSLAADLALKRALDRDDRFVGIDSVFQPTEFLRLGLQQTWRHRVFLLPGQRRVLGF